jgi:hypothetical protein
MKAISLLVVSVFLFGQELEPVSLPDFGPALHT